MVGINDISLKYKLTIIILLLGVVPVLVLGVISYNKAAHDLDEAVGSKMEAIEHLKTEEIHFYYDTIEKQIMTMSHSSAAIHAAEDFVEAFHAYPEEAELTQNDLRIAESNVRSFYKDLFIPLLEPNVAFQPNVDMFVEETDATLALQDRFIASSPYPIGEKHKLKSLGDGTSYDIAHQKYHREFKQFLEEFGYYDIFILDPNTGHIVYSVFKEIDYGTSLLTGPYKDTNFADAYRDARAATEDHSYYLHDFAPYDPSYHAPASFISSPIMTDEGELVGVLIFQMPVDRINGVMTSNEHWETVGLGETGESFLVGTDLKLRSDPRRFIEDKEHYLHELEETGYSAEDINYMDKLDTAIGIETFDAEYVRNALDGKTNIGHYVDPIGHKVIAAYSSVDVGGVEYAIITQIDEKEAFETVYEMRSFMIFIVVISAIIIAVIGVLLTMSIVSPINRIVKQLKDIAEGEGDLTKRVASLGKDEIGQLAKYFNQFVSNVQDILQSVAKSAGVAASTAEELSASSEEVNSSTQQIANTVQELAKGGQKLSDTASKSKSQTDQLIESVGSVAQSASAVSTDAQEANAAAEKGQKSATLAGEKMQQISDSVKNSASVIKTLSDKTEQINKIIEVINQISEQTNLLALNAAIEAARAGEAGKGFAVVADEVRKLAEESQRATKQIETMISEIVQHTQGAVTSMQDGTKQVGEGSQIVGEALNNLQFISKKISGLTTQIQAISSATGQQEKSASEVHDAISGVSAIAEESAAGAEEVSASVEETTSSVQQVASSAQELAKSSDELKAIVGKFKLQ